MIQKAITLEDPKKKMAFAVIIASYMKMAFKNWNKEHYVSDEIIKEDLFNMSKGVLEIPEETVLEVAGDEGGIVQNEVDVIGSIRQTADAAEEEQDASQKLS